MNYTVEQYDSRESWLMARKRGLGASDAAPILGMSRFRGAYSVATDKLTEAIDESTPDETAEWGTRHEPAIAKKFAEVMEARGESLEIRDPGDFTIARSLLRPHLFCTPDRLIYNVGALTAELSLKCAFYESAKEWNKAVPLGYQIQAQHTMYVLGVDTVYYAVLLNGCAFKWHLIRRNERWIEKMLTRLDAFWASIQRGEYPNVDASAATAEALARRYPRAGDSLTELPAEFTSMGDEYDDILKQSRDLEKRKLLIQNTVREAIGENRIGVLSDQSGFAWKANGHGTRTFQRVKKVREVENG